MKTSKTIYHIVLDKSGSMQSCQENTINGFNEQLKKIRSLEYEFPEQDICVGLTTFNHTVYHHYGEAPAHAAAFLGLQNYRPSGSTSLLDAIGVTALQIEENLKSFLPTTVVMVIITDGYENSSTLFNLDQIRTLIKRLEATCKWTFSFIGATLDAVDVAKSMAIRQKNSYSFSKEEMHKEVWDKLSGSMKGYFGKKRDGGNYHDLFDEDK